MYIINDLNQFADYIRKISFEKFSKANDSVNDDFSVHLSQEKDSKKVDDIISTQEVEIIILSITKKNKKGHFPINDKKLVKIIENINGRIVSNLLNSLVNKNIMETAYDEDINDFIFWLRGDKID